MEIRANGGSEVERSIWIRRVPCSRWIEDVANRTALRRWRMNDVSHLVVLNLQDMREWKEVLSHEALVDEMRV